jgi:hypothetical protein
LLFAGTLVLTLVAHMAQTYFTNGGYEQGWGEKPFCVLVPLPWFPFVGFMVTFWCVFRESRKLAFSANVLWLCLFLFMAAGGLLVFKEVVFLHSVALSPPPPGVVTIAFNWCMTAAGALIVVSDVVKLVGRRKGQASAKEGA